MRRQPGLGRTVQKVLAIRGKKPYFYRTIPLVAPIADRYILAHSNAITNVITYRKGFTDGNND